MNPQDLNAALCRALGLPTQTRRAVITLEAGQDPKVEIECFELPLRVVQDHEGIKSIASLNFRIRLEPFPTTTKDVNP
jgi:hypothetical protein